MEEISDQTSTTQSAKLSVKDLGSCDWVRIFALLSSAAYDAPYPYSKSDYAEAGKIIPGAKMVCLPCDLDSRALGVLC